MGLPSWSLGKTVRRHRFFRFQKISVGICWNSDHARPEAGLTLIRGECQWEYLHLHDASTCEENFV